MVRYLFLVMAIGLMLSTAAVAQEKEGGFYKMQLPGTNETAHVFLKKSGDKIEGYDLATGTPFSSSVKGDSSKMTVFLPKSKRTITATVKDTPTDGFEVDLPAGWPKSDQPIHLVKITSAWECGVHTPKHVAESPDEMKKLSDSAGCQLWQPVPRK